MALYIPHSIFHLVRLLYVRPETFGPYYVHRQKKYYVIIAKLILLSLILLIPFLFIDLNILLMTQIEI